MILMATMYKRKANMVLAEQQENNRKLQSRVPVALSTASATSSWSWEKVLDKVLGPSWRRDWDELCLATCRRLRVHWPYGRVAVYDRSGAPLSGQIPASPWWGTVQHLGWYLVDTVDVHVHEAIGGGFVTIAWRGTVGVTSVVLKTNLYIEDMTDERPVAKEWSRLCEQVPSNPQEATALPIPAYHGWFVGVEADIIAMTYHGQSLDEIDDADGHLQDAYKRALDVLRNAGIEPNDIAPRNAVYDGSVVRCIDFV